MSSISALNINNNNLLSSTQANSQSSNSTNSQSGTTAAAASSLNIQDVVSLELIQSKESLIQSLFSSNSSSAQNTFNMLEESATLTAIEKTNLFSTNPQMAEALLGINSPSGSAGNAAAPTDSSSQSTKNTGTTSTSAPTLQSADSSDTIANLINTIEQSNLSQTNPDLEQSLLQTISNYINNQSSNFSGSTIDLTA
jgi:hypothetical protein